MKWFGIAVVLASLAAAASADAATARPDRNSVISQCIQLAQKAAPNILDQNDPGARTRMNVYSSCMRKSGQRP